MDEWQKKIRVDEWRKVQGWVWEKSRGDNGHHFEEQDERLGWCDALFKMLMPLSVMMVFSSFDSKYKK